MHVVKSFAYYRINLAKIAFCPLIKIYGSLMHYGKIGKSQKDELITTIPKKEVES